jgi:putative FmdB family regulatory protein
VPTYEYECGSCHRTFEVRQRISEPALTACDVCGGPVHRLLSAAPFILKGAGWYVTDYPSEARKKGLNAEKSSSSTSESKSESKPESKSESKSDSKSESKSDKADKPAAAPAKSDSGGTSGASSAASSPKSD